MEGRGGTQSLTNIKIRKHSEEKVAENKRAKQTEIQLTTDPSIYYQTNEVSESIENMSSKNDMATALIEAFKNEEVKQILYGYCNNMIEDTKNKLETKINKEVQKIDTKTTDLEERIVALEKLADDCEQKSRSHNVIVRGLKVSEDYTKSIVNMMNQGLGISANSQDIKFIIKLTLKNEAEGTASVKVSYHDRRLRDEVYGRRLKLKGTNVFISEDLTITKSGLAFEARKYAREIPNVSTWTMDGQIYIKDAENAKPRAIHKKSELKPAPTSNNKQF